MKTLEDCHKIAFGIISSQLKGLDDVPVSDVYAILCKNRGDIRIQATNLIALLYPREWGWSNYEESYLEENILIKNNESRVIIDADLESILSRFTVSHLKSMACEFGLKSSEINSLKKQELICRISPHFNECILFSLKQTLISRLPNPQPLSRKKIAELFIGRIDDLAHRLYNFETLNESRDLLPYWELHSMQPDNAYEKCSFAFGKQLHYTDKFWDGFDILCSKIDCACYVNGLTEKMCRKQNPANA